MGAKMKQKISLSSEDLQFSERRHVFKQSESGSQHVQASGEEEASTVAELRGGRIMEEAE